MNLDIVPNFFGADKDIILWNKIKEFSRLYHQIGNFIVIPNRSSVQYGINGARGVFIIIQIIAKACETILTGFWLLWKSIRTRWKMGILRWICLKCSFSRTQNIILSSWRSVSGKKYFFLKHYFENDKPKLLFNTLLERRLLITAEHENRKDEKYYQDQEYLELMNDYLDKSKEVIVYRTNKIVDILKEKM